MEGIWADSQMFGKRERDAGSEFAARLYIEDIFVGGHFLSVRITYPWEDQGHIFQRIEKIENVVNSVRNWVEGP